MSLSDHENLGNSVDPGDIVARGQHFIAANADNAAAAAAIREGKEIAAIVRTLGLSENLLAAVEIYPLVRDQIVDIKALENNDLGDLSRIVIDLLQLGGFALPAGWRPGEALAVKQSEALRKMLLAVVSDVRLVLVRIAEQLYRLRQARNASRDVQQAIAAETREIYAALANRLGVWQLKWELEDLAFRYLDPDTYKSIAEALNEKRQEREDFIEQVKSTLQAELAKQGVKAEISGRPKHIYSIWRKMQRKNRGLESLYDIRAVRVLVDDVKDCYAALGAVHNLWSYLPGEFDDYIANPKDNNYQSLHTAVVGPEGKTVEVQIRSHAMHRQAELGVAAHWRYKEGGGSPAAFDQKIRFLRQLLDPSGDAEDLLAQIRDDVFEDRVYAVSPKGDVVELPARATPLDFAYNVHTQVGHRCRGAKVNGRIVPLTYQVQNGDKIEIITGSQSRPSRDWLSPKLGYLAGPRNRAKVRHWFRHQDRDQHQRQGREILDRELSRLNVRDIATDDIARQLKLKNTEALCVSLGAGDLTSSAIATALQHLRGAETPDKIKLRRSAKRKSRTSESIPVSGVGDLLCNFARCCRPVPPEPIVGYITQGRGVSIHRQDCGNFLGLNQRNPERIIQVDWGESESATYPVDLTLHAYDRSGLIRDISTVLADEHANVIDLSSHTDKKTMQTVMDISIEIQDLPTLSTAITRLEQLSNVVSVRRKA
ncbi:MAG: bifunctional (p)ppGpp synthetase/guanosine-3',5'-bis(diphosphate) 3'-pyrophosphohydrolase [Gammaproteobacteria bacterium]|nr:bifunctional (p)ppGpp synthetase/guanosine-3',5'-bis(diphosphate) 3'-pyrophosphohydrolase [Gammaproteobacteria bacterium]MDH3434337.1 bifunctional (p)ppGpp synthetase/guanosine-3',5'-bis(diphosphate) 3'-pyrophosphohydrolase [Gammaproteobacteria bacterium]